MKAQGQPDWIDVEGADVEDIEPQPHQRIITIPQHGTIGARMSAGLGTRWLVWVGDLDGTPEGEAPDMWNGVVASWLPSDGDRLRLIVQAASRIEDMG
jgi:hypothetical protein